MFTLKRLIGQQSNSPLVSNRAIGFEIKEMKI